MTDTAAAFSLGFDYGRSVLNITPRLAEMNLRQAGMEASDSNITAFCEGATDGILGDTFRLIGEPFRK